MDEGENTHHSRMLKSTTFIFEPIDSEKIRVSDCLSNTVKEEIGEPPIQSGDLNDGGEKLLFLKI